MDKQQKIQPQVVKPGMNMPTSSQDLKVQPPPANFLSYGGHLPAPLLDTTSPPLPPMQDATSQYSGSEIKARWRNRKKLLYIALTLAVFGSAILYGTGTYEKVVNNPNKDFWAMMSNVSTTSSVSYSSKRISPFGLSEGNVSYSSNESLQSTTDAKVDVSVSNGGLNADMSFEFIATDAAEVFVNMTNIQLSSSSLYTSAQDTALAEDVWVRIPSGIDLNSRGVVMGLFGSATRNVNTPFRVLPYGISAYEAIREQDYYDPDCSRTTEEDGEYTECVVTVDKVKMESFYRGLADKYSIAYPDGLVLPDSFEVLIEQKSLLPVYVSISLPDQVTLSESYNSYDSEPTASKPVGALEIEAYEARIAVFESLLR